MARTFIAEMRSGQPVDEVFLLRRCELKSTKTGSLYLAAVLADRTGQVEGRMWEASRTLYEALQEDAFVRVKGVAETYRNQLQISIKMITMADTASLRLGDFLPQAERSPKEMMAELREFLGQVEDEDYRRINAAFLADADFLAAFRTAPAAVSYHHAYLGGLLEHTLNLLRLAGPVLEQYPVLRKDLLLTAIFLHDVGKTRELRYTRTFTYTDSGQLVGHLVLGVLMLDEKARQIEAFPPDKLDLLRHCILSHHGQYDFGSPKLPMIAEAMALHYLDNLDAKIKDFAECLEADLQSKSDWTDYVPQFQRRLFKK